MCKRNDKHRFSQIKNGLTEIYGKAKRSKRFRDNLTISTTNRSLSRAKVIRHIESHTDLGSISVRNFETHPIIFKLYRTLKFLVEGFSGEIEEIARTHASLIEEVRSSPHKNSTDLSSNNRDLYDRVRKLAYAKAIWLLAEFGNLKNYYYAPDQWLIDECEAYRSFSHLKSRNHSLHIQIKGRELEGDVVLAHPSYATNFYVGLNNQIYRSVPELTVGNWFVHRKIPHTSEQRIPLSGNDRPRVVDFFLDAHGLYLELLQNTAKTHNKRRLAYVNRTRRKKRQFARAGMRVAYVSSDEFFAHGVLNASAFCNEVRHCISKFGVDLPEIPTESILMTVRNHEKGFLLQAPTSELIDHILDEIGVEGIAEFQNQHSTIRTLLKCRRDFEEIELAIRKNGAISRSEKTTDRFAENRAKYAPIRQVKSFIGEHGIHGQKSWQSFCRRNKPLLVKRSIPSDLYSVYRRRGEWTSWGDLWSE